MEHFEIDVRKKEAEWTKDSKNESHGEIKNGNDAGELNVEECNKEENAESSESDAETEPARSFHRKLSTNKEIKDPVSSTLSFIFFFLFFLFLSLLFIIRTQHFFSQ